MISQFIASVCHPPAAAYSTGNSPVPYGTAVILPVCHLADTLRRMMHPGRDEKWNLQQDQDGGYYLHIIARIPAYNLPSHEH